MCRVEQSARRSDDPCGYLGKHAEREQYGNHVYKPAPFGAELRDEDGLERLDDAERQIGIERFGGKRGSHSQSAKRIERDRHDDEHDHGERVVAGRVLQLVDMRSARLDTHVGQDERCEDHERIHLAEIGDKRVKVHRYLRSAAGDEIRSQADEQDRSRKQNASEKADLRDTGGKLRTAELRERERPHDDRNADEHDERVLVESIPLEHVGQRRQHEERHRYEPDGDLEPLEEQSCEAPALSERIADPGEDASRLPPLDRRHFGSA